MGRLLRRIFVALAGVTGLSSLPDVGLTRSNDPSADFARRATVARERLEVLQPLAGQEHLDSNGPRDVAQWFNFPNWPNWNNWANGWLKFPNWGNYR